MRREVLVSVGSGGGEMHFGLNQVPAANLVHIHIHTVLLCGEAYPGTDGTRSRFNKVLETRDAKEPRLRGHVSLASFCLFLSSIYQQKDAQKFQQVCKSWFSVRESPKHQVAAGAPLVVTSEGEGYSCQH